MSKAADRPKVPKLRFPEFEGEWEAQQLSSLVDEKRKVTYGIVQPGEFVEDGVPLVRGGDYSDGWVTLDKIVRVTHEIDRPYKRSKLQRGDLLLTIVGANTGTVAVVPEWLEGANITQTTARIAIDKTKADPSFMEQALQTRAGRREVYKFLKGAAQPGLNLSDVEKFAIAAPELEEQSKVASFVKAVDQRIFALSRKLERVETYKKGMMQRLFSQELRFTREDGSPFPDWEEKRLGELAQFVRGANLSKGDLSCSGLYPAIHYGELFTVYREIISEVISRTDRQDCTESVCGDVLMPSSDVTPDGLARGSTIQVSGAMIGGDVNIVRPSANLVSAFLSYWISGHRKRFMRLVSGTTVKHLYISDLKTIIIDLPHPEEQRKIADFLTALDEKIDAVAGQIDAMQRFKKGLLQQMFV